MRTLHKDALLKSNSKVSIITYNSGAKPECEAVEPSVQNVIGLSEPDGGTDFNPPLNYARKILDKYGAAF